MMDSASKWITRASLIALTAFSIAAADTPLTNEGIVRMTASRVPESEILKAISTAEEVDFDLSPDVLSEMRLVGVTEAVIEAMRERAGTKEDRAAPALEGLIEVSFELEKPGADKLPGISLPRTAFFLICVDPTHVPDHWTTKTPLAENFPRHHRLWVWEPPILASDEGGKQKRAKRLTLPAPARVTVPADVHPIMAGIAIWTDDQTWKPIATAERTLAIEPGATTRLVLSVALHKPPAKQPVTLTILEPAAASSVEGSPAP